MPELLEALVVIYRGKSAEADGPCLVLGGVVLQGGW